MLTSDIINQDNYHVFDRLLLNINSNANKLTKLYSSETDGNTVTDIQEHLRHKSKLVFLVKTIENKIFGAYVSQLLNYDNTVKMDNGLSLFSVDLNEWFSSRKQRDGAFRLNLSDYNNVGLHITYSTLVLFGVNNKCYYNSLDTDNFFNMNGYTVAEIFGGYPSQDVEDCNEFNIIAVEVYQA